MEKRKEEIMKFVFLLAACASIATVAMICLFLFANGLPTISKIGAADFFLGERWRPANDVYGILPMILGSLYVTLGAIVVGVPVGILTAVFMARFCPEKIYNVLKPSVELLAGIPSVVYGFFGLVVMVPFIREHIGGTGSSMLTALIMVAGNQARMPIGILEGVRTMTTNIVIEMGYAADLHRDALIATAVVLFVFILIINLTFSYLKGKVVQQ